MFRTDRGRKQNIRKPELDTTRRQICLRDSVNLSADGLWSETDQIIIPLEIGSYSDFRPSHPKSLSPAKYLLRIDFSWGPISKL